MKKTIIKAVILGVVFIIGIFLLTQFKTKENTDELTTMGKSTLPTIYLTSYGENLNELHGYLDEMEANYMRDTITPLQEDRSLPITINCYDSKIKELSYEVRSLDTERLVEETGVTDFQKKDDTVKATLNIKNLLEDDKEYILKIMVTTDTAKNINYYTRIVKNSDLNVKAKVDFVKDFNKKTFDKSQAEDLVIYLESNSSGDNSTFNKVNINSKFEQVTWGSLNIKAVTEPVPEIKEIDDQTASIYLNYVVSVVNENDFTEYYTIKEYYRVRYTQDRIYLLDFERIMNQVFDAENSVYKENRLTLGIADNEIEYKDNSSGNIVAFVQEGELYSLNITDNKIFKLFSFKDDFLDARENYNQYDIKILKVDDVGNVSFLVYGYMNRGDHEGQVGIDVFFYNSSLNTTEESVFIPSARPYQIIKESIHNFVYLSDQNKMYLDVDDTIYNIDLSQRSYSVVIDNLTPNGYVISKDNNVIAWQNGEDNASSSQITIQNLSSGQKNTVEVGEDERVMPIGFMDEDFIYGVAKVEDIMSDPTGAIMFPMYCIRIQDNTGNIIEEYQRDGIYIVSAQIIDNVIKLIRATFDATGYTYLDEDTIMNSLEAVSGKTSLSSVVTETKETLMQLVLSKNVNETNPIIVNPKQVLVQDDITLNINTTKEELRYYVYAKGMLQGIYRNVGEAVIEANNMTGVVVDENQEYIWERGNRLIRTQVSNITAKKDASSNSLAICLDSILEIAGTYVDSASLLERGDNAVSILEEYLDGTVIELSNTPLNAALYYVSKGSPVIAKMDENTSVLIVGYDELNITIMNPETGTIYKIGMNDSTELFEAAGGMFVTYIKNNK